MAINLGAVGRTTLAAKSAGRQQRGLLQPMVREAEVVGTLARLAAHRGATDVHE